MTTDSLLQNVKVLAVDQEINQAKAKPQVAKSVTLEVTPEQTQMLVLAQQVGTLSLALRNANSVQSEPPRSVSLRDLNATLAGTVAPEADDARPAPTNGAPNASPNAGGGLEVNVYRGGVKAAAYEVTKEAAENRDGKKK